ncbi:MAG: hypothetical protein R3A79_25160 [Nannocystaceae bacterium]
MPGRRRGVAGDTLVYHLGALAAAALARAAAEPAFDSRYGAWIARAAQLGLASREVESILTARAGSCVVTLLAEQEPGAFLLRCVDPDFDALVTVDVDLSRRSLSGVFVSHFRGDEAAATHMVNAARVELEARAEVSRSPTPAAVDLRN